MASPFRWKSDFGRRAAVVLFSQIGIELFDALGAEGVREISSCMTAEVGFERVPPTLGPPNPLAVRTDRKDAFSEFQQLRHIAKFLDDEFHTFTVFAKCRGDDLLDDHLPHVAMLVEGALSLTRFEYGFHGAFDVVVLPARVIQPM